MSVNYYALFIRNSQNGSITHCFGCSSVRMSHIRKYLMDFEEIWYPKPTSEVYEFNF